MGTAGAAWQPGFEARAAKGTEEQPNLDTAIRDRECAESILDRVQLFFGNVLFETPDEFIVTHQLHFITKLEAARVFRKDIAS